MEKHTGLLFKLQPTDFITGATGVEFPVVLPTADWLPYKPLNEKQYLQATFDTMSCATFSCLNVIETWLHFHREKGNFTKKQLDKLNELGFFADGLANCSDRYTAIMSGTMKIGNYMQTVLDSVRHDGLLPDKDFAFGGTTWEEYHDKTKITEDMKAKAKEILKIIKISYAWVQDPSDLSDDLTRGGIQGAIPETASHAVQVINPTTVFDTYEPFIVPKPTVRYALLIVVTVLPEETLSNQYIFTTTMKYGMRTAEVKKLQERLKKEGYFKGVTCTGYFGSFTLVAVKAYQKANGLTADGIVGARTRVVLNTLKKKS
jgi:hypothetical protein